MLGTQQYYQPQYNDTQAWQHGVQQENRNGYAPASKMNGHDYNRAAANHNTPNQNNGMRPLTAGNLEQNGNASLAMTEQQGPPSMEQMSEENQKVVQWVSDLMEPSKREGALMELSKKREQVPELALILWHSFGVMTSLLQEIISVYPLLNPSQLTAAASNRVCNALALLQCVASHNETRGLFLNGKSCQTRFEAGLIRDSAHPPLPLPIPQHHIKVPTIRIPPSHKSRRHRRFSQKRTSFSSTQRWSSTTTRKQLFTNHHIPPFN